MNIITTVQNGFSARLFAAVTIVSLLLTAFPVAFFVAEAANTDAVGDITLVVNPSPASGDEFVRISFAGTGTLNLAGWTIEETLASVGVVYTFGAQTLVDGEDFTICAASCDDVFSATGAIWNNDGDMAVLKDENGATVLTTEWNTTVGDTEVSNNVSVNYAPPAPVACSAQIEDGATTGPIQNTDSGDFFTTIQNAIDDCDTESGDTITVAAGSYLLPQVTIDKNLSIIGADRDTVIITPSENTNNNHREDDSAWILVEAGNEFNLSGVTLDGDSANYGITRAITTYGTGVISNNIIKNIASGAKYQGMGVTVYGDVIIKDNTFENIQRIGVHVRKAYSGTAVGTATISGNTFTGQGPGDWVEYGVEVGGASYALVQGNTMTNFKGVALSDGSVSAGILVTDFFGTGTKADIEENVLDDNSNGVTVGYAAPDKTIANINRNDIINNDDNGVLALENTVVDATKNWWGDVTGPSGQNAGTGDVVSEYAPFSPWLCGPFESNPDSSKDGSCAQPPTPEPDNATLRVCKIVVDTNGDITDGAYAPADFSVTIDGPNSYTNTVTFSTALTLDTNLVTDNLEANDAACVVLKNLDAGMYTYTAETINNTGDATWATPLYHDYFNQTPTTVDGFFELTVDGQPGDNDNADGVINVKKAKQRTLAIVNTIESVPGVTVSATKIVCDYEDELPNWGKKAEGPVMITADTAQTWLDTDGKDTSCKIVPDWEFEWAASSAKNPGNDFVGTGGSDWTTFTDAAVVPLTTVNSASFWVREVLPADYIPFGGSNNRNDVSAELHCHKDGLNYDNYDRIDNPKVDETYHCVAWNVPKELPPQTCSIYSDTQTLVVESNEPAIATYDGNNNWTASIPGATWIWATEQVQNPSQNETYTFVETFTVDNPTSALLSIAADNTYRVYVNGVVVPELDRVADYDTNFTTASLKEDVDIKSFLNLTGENTITFEVINLAGTDDYRKNPAGVLYRLDIESPVACVVTTEPVDDVRPVVTVVSPVDAIEVTENFDITVNATDDRGIAQLVINLYDTTGAFMAPCLNSDGSAVLDFTDSCTVDISDLTPGTYSFKTNARDTAGNLSNTITQTFVVGQTVAPEPDMMIITGLKSTITGEQAAVLASGWVMELRDTEGVVIDTATTDETGAYSFTVVEGIYQVHETMQTNWNQTSVLAIGGFVDADTAGQSFCSFDAANYVSLSDAITSEDTTQYSCNFLNTLSDDNGGSTGGEVNPETPTVSTASFRSTAGGTRIASRALPMATPTPLVAGVQTSQCPFLVDFMQMGADNEAMEVMKLQVFLNIFKDMYGGTANPVTGNFGIITDTNVKAFQQHFGTEILTPWFEQGIVSHTKPTGFVYKTTLWKINDIVCGADFPSLEGENLDSNTDKNAAAIAD